MSRRACGSAALRLARSMAALRLARSMAALRLCGFDALQGARVYPNPRAMLSCSFDSSHSFEIFSLSLDSCWLSKSFFRFSLLFFRFRPLFRSSPILFVRLLSFV